jgi:ABC-2 type transport system permease protein
MFKLWATIKKDVRILLRDRVGIALMFIMPIILVIVATGIQNSTFQLVSKNKLPVLVCNLDTGKLGKEFIKDLGQIGMFSVTETGKGKSAKQLADAMQRTNATLAVIIPQTFSAMVQADSKLAAGKALKSFGLEGDSVKRSTKAPDALTMYYNPVLQQSVQMSVKGALQSVVQMVESRQTLRILYFSINEKPLPQKLEDEMLDNKTVVNEIPVTKDKIRETPNATQHNVPAWTIFAMFFVIMSLSGSVVREKTSGSFIRLKTLPTNFMVGLFSKQITYMGVTLLQALVIFSIGFWLFPYMGLPALNAPSNIIVLIITTLICGWCAVSYAICVGIFAKTQEQANGFGAISIVILAVVGGLMVPTFAMQGFVKTVSSLSPLHWCLEAYYSLFLTGGTLGVILSNLLYLLGITILIQLIVYLGLIRKNLI